MYVCLSVSVTVTVAICMQGHRLRIRDEKVQIGLLFQFPAVGALKFGFGNLLLFGLLFKILMAILGYFSIYFDFGPFFWATKQNERIFSLKFVGILKCVKIREFPEFLKFIIF